MSLLHNNFFSDLCNVLDYADPRIENYFLMKSPLPIITILIFYILFVFKIGPAIMKNRQPFQLKWIIMVYNLVQIIVNGAVFIVALKELPHVSIFCTPMDKTNSPFAISIMNLQYYYTLTKVLDLLDTIFFVLRKSKNQVTFLHMYHHLLMCCGAWISTKFFIGGHVYFLGVPNLFVHVVMYFYYFLTSLDSAYAKSFWWKKHLTQLQIVQHFFVCVAFALPLLNTNCSYPKILLAMYLSQGPVMIYLFMKFYLKAYGKNKSKVQ